MSGDEVKTDFSKIDRDGCTARDFPGGGGGDSSKGLRVSLGRRAFDQICKHTAEDSDHEVCGVMLGDLCRDDKGPFLHITEIIEGAHATNQGAQVTITHDTWNHFHKVKDRDFADKQYMGWYHSHPDFGIFLSAMDLFIHENFFSAPHQVALVIDPIRREEGLFFWKDGKPERAESFWVGASEHKYQPAPEPSGEQLALRELGKRLERSETRLRELTEAVMRGPEGAWLQTALLVGMIFLLALGVYSDYRRDRAKQIEDVSDLMRRVMLQINPDPVKKTVDMTFRLPPERYLVERIRDPQSGEMLLKYTVDLIELQQQLDQYQSSKADGDGTGWRRPEGLDATGGGANGNTDGKAPAGTEGR